MNFAACILLATLPLVVPEKLTYISAPKSEIPYNGNPSKAEQDAHDSYRKLYRRFMMYGGYLEREYDRAGKPAHLKSCIDTMNKLGKSANWKNILSLQPFKVKSGVKNITDSLNKMSFTVSDIIDKEDQAHNKLIGIQPVADVKPPVGNNPFAADPRDTPLQSGYKNWQSSANDSLRQAKYETNHREKKKALKMAMREMDVSNRIKEEAKQNGEMWAQDP